MIRVEMQPEPDDFDVNVRVPGRRFLGQIPQPVRHQWKSHEYWQACLPRLYEVYNGICAFSAEWIPETVGDPTVEHFLPKGSFAELAYEWSNYRLCSLRYNGRKGDVLNLVDPFEILGNWFMLQFPSLRIMPNPDLELAIATRVENTIDRLRLDDERARRSRLRWVIALCNHDITFSFLQRNAPFIAYEIERQQLVDIIESIMLY